VPETVPSVLTIAGLDPSGGAGLPADVRACAAFGAHALPVATAVIAQNTQGVFCFEAVSPSLLAAQLDTILADVKPKAVKTGMIPSAEAVEIIAARVKSLGVPLIVDPVFAPSSGPAFSQDETISALCEKLLPLCDCVTPNLPEAEKLLGTKMNAGEAASAIAEKFGVRAVLLKGGHAPESDEVCDVLWDGVQLHTFCAPRIHGIEVRGTGCMLASAIAAQRAQNIPLPDAVRAAKAWLTGQIQNAQPIGQGRRVAVRG
jgi:hydroxymethylpyrimidine/phosphomethylpyrimidine kinase